MPGGQCHETVSGGDCMNDKASHNLAHSVHQRLLNLSRNRDIDFNLLLIWYGLERLLYRMTRLAHGQKFVLKGALLFPVAWTFISSNQGSGLVRIRRRFTGQSAWKTVQTLCGHPEKDC